jgi:hypothetical protein
MAAKGTPKVDLVLSPRKMRGDESNKKNNPIYNPKNSPINK